VKYAIKAIDKKRVQDYETFITEVKVLKKTVNPFHLLKESSKHYKLGGSVGDEEKRRRHMLSGVRVSHF
jgi:hypothetical protein